MKIISTKMINEILINNKKDFEALFPELIKRLIISSLDYKNIRIPSHDDIWARGFDGDVEVLSENPFLNIGNNVIEIGTDSIPIAKINSDYEKRKNNSLGKKKKDTHFVLITPFVWSYKISIDQWINQRKKEWKSIKIFDGIVICDWLNSQPNVLCWFLERYSNTKLDFYSVDNYWDIFSNKSDPILSVDLFLNERESACETLFSKLFNHKECLVQSNCVIDAIGFSLAAIKTNNELLNNTIVVENENTCKIIDKECKGKIIFCTYPVLSTNYMPRNNVLVSCYSNENRLVNPISLDKIARQSFFNFLKNTGQAENEINNEIDLFRCNLLAYIRRHPNKITELTPKWVDFENIKLIVPFIFFSKLNISNKETKKLIEYITGENFGFVEEKLNKILKMDDSPIYKDNNVIYVFDHDECINNLLLPLDSIEIQGVINLIKKQFLEDFSYIRVFDFFSLLMNFVKFLYIQYGNSQKEIDEVLTDIISCPINKGKISWAKYLHYFVDASPLICMDFIENYFLSGIKDLCYENEIRWCLEKLCCYEKTKFKSVKLLFKLVMEQDDSNHFMETLSNVLCLWLGYSSFSLNEKKIIIKSYLDNYDEKVFKFVLKLIVKDSAFIGSSTKTSNNDRYNCSQKDLSDAINELAIYTLEKSNYKSEVILSIFDSFKYFRKDVFKNIANNVYESEKYFYCIYKLTNLMTHFNKFFIGDNNWCSYKEYYFDTFKLILSKMIGNSLWLKYGCSFIDYNKCFYGNYESNEFEYKDSYIEEVRANYLEILINEYPEEYLSKLSVCMSNTTYWGFFIAKNICLKTIAKNINLFYKKKNILVGILSKIEKVNFMEILQKLDKGLRLFVVSNIVRDDADEIFNDEDKKTYWKNKVYYPNGNCSFSQIKKYNPSGLLHYYLYWNKKVSDINEYIELLELIRIDFKNNPEKKKQNKSDYYSLIEMIDNICFDERFANICLEEYLNDSLRINNNLKLYLFEKTDVLIKILPKNYNLSYSYEFPKDAFLNKPKFMSFIKIMINQGDLFKDFLGQSLARGPIGSDEIFPHEFIRDILEMNDETIITGFKCGYIDKKGGRFVENGDEERKISISLKENAKILSIKYPITAEILNYFADYYETIAENNRINYEIGSRF